MTAEQWSEHSCVGELFPLPEMSLGSHATATGYHAEAVPAVGIRCQGPFLLADCPSLQTVVVHPLLWKKKKVAAASVFWVDPSPAGMGWCSQSTPTGESH